MTIYNSQRVNNDPKPYVVYADHRRTEMRCIPWVEDITGGGSVDYCYVYEPRPKYDNNPNPILERFRSSEGRAELWAALIEAELRFPDCCETEEHKKKLRHAHRVLTKLINVYKETA